MCSLDGYIAEIVHSGSGSSNIPIMSVLTLTPTKCTLARTQARNTNQCSKAFALFREVQIIIQPLPRIHLFHIQTRLTISKRRKEPEAPTQHSNDNTTRRPCSEKTLPYNSFTHRSPRPTRCVFDVLVRDISWLDVEDEFNDSASY